MYHRVCKSVIYSNEKNEPHLFPYSRVVLHFIACYGYNVDRWSFPPKAAISHQKTLPNGVYPYFLAKQKKGPGGGEEDERMRGENMRMIQQDMKGMSFDNLP